VLPGFVDAHTHPVGKGSTHTNLLVGVTPRGENTDKAQIRNFQNTNCELWNVRSPV
jgi:predicted amidohydrolase YtcJ